MDRLFCMMMGLDKGIFDTCSLKWRRKYRRSGYVMLTTGIICMASAAYSFYLIFNSLLIAIPVSVLWAMVILNLYRLVLITVGNPHIPHHPKYRFPFGSFVFRSIFLIVLGLFIVKPFELLIMSGKIEPHLNEHRQNIVNEHNAKLESFRLEKIKEIFTSNYSIDERANENGYLMTRISIMHREFGGVWAMTTFLLFVFIQPFWARVRWRKKSEYEQARGNIEKELVVHAYQDFKVQFTKVMFDLTGRTDIWEEEYHDMPFKNEPVVYKEQDLMRPGSLHAWARIYANEQMKKE